MAVAMCSGLLINKTQLYIVGLLADRPVYQNLQPGVLNLSAKSQLRLSTIKGSDSSYGVTEGQVEPARKKGFGCKNSIEGLVDEIGQGEAEVCMPGGFLAEEGGLHGLKDQDSGNDKRGK